MIGLLSRLDHFSGFNTGSANAEPLHILTDKGANRLQVRLEYSFCPVIGMTD